MAMNTITPSAGRTRNALAIATPSKKVCNSSPTSADVPASRLTACVSSPKWKCGVTVCWVRCTARYPPSTSAGAAAPLRANASGRISTMATASMNPAPKATKCSITWRPSAARRVTASAPTTLPSAATRAYITALDTGEQVLLRVAGGILEHLGEQALQRLAHAGAGSHAGGEEVVAGDGKVFQRHRVLGGADRCHDRRQSGNGKRETGNVERREQRQELVGVLAGFREPAAHLRDVPRIGILVAPGPDRTAPFDVLVGALEPSEQRGRIGGQIGRDEHRIPRQLVHLPRFPFPATVRESFRVSRLSDFRQPDPRRPYVHPQRQKFRDPCGRHDPLEPLVPHTLGRELRQPLDVRLRGLERARVNPELKPRAEAQRPQDAQVILLKAPVGVAHGADQLALQVRRALEGILPAVRDGVVGDRVDRVVAPREIVHQRDAELHHGVPAIRPDVLAERRHLMGRAALVQHRDRTVLDPHGNRALEQAAHLVRRRRGRQIEIVVLETEQVVPDRPAHAPGLVAGVFQLLRYPEDFFRDWEAGRELHPTNCVGSGEWYQTVRPAAPVRTVAYHSPLPTPWFSHTAPFPR